MSRTANKLKGIFLYKYHIVLMCSDMCFLYILKV